MSTWTTTVDQLVRNFLMALNASIPSMQAARILDENLTGFDDWERLCDTCYSLLVIEPIRSSLPEAQRKTFDLPSYETEYEFYIDFSFIQVTTKDEAGAPRKMDERRMLLRFLPGEDVATGFSVVETMRVSEKLVLDEMSFAPVKADEVYFTCIVPDGAGWRVLDEIEVRLD